LSDELKSKDINLTGFDVEDNSLNKNITASLSLTSGYDTNYNIHHESDKLDDFYDTTDQPTKEASMFYQSVAKVGYTKEFDNNIYFNSQFSSYDKYVSKDTNYNVKLKTFEIGIGYYTQKYNIYIPIAYSSLFYLNQDYLSVLSIRPQLDYKINNEFIVSLNTKYEKRKLIVDNDRDDKNVGFGTMMYYNVEKFYLFGDFEYQHYTSNGVLTQAFTDKTIFTISGGGGYNFAHNITLNGVYRVSYGKYVDNIGTANEPNDEIRSDEYHQLTFKLSKKFTKNLVFYIENDYSKNNSNFLPADYYKNVFSVGVNLIY
jgi:hypothetical protein